jgi:hypothetical protein
MGRGFEPLLALIKTKSLAIRRTHRKNGLFVNQL